MVLGTVGCANVGSAFRSRVRNGFAFGLGLLLLVPFAAGATGPAGAGESAWITLGADAFDTLRQGAGITHETMPLVSYGAASGVVVTRVDAVDLDRISGILHEAHRRCGGFLLHPDLEHARATLAAVGASAELGGGVPFEVDQAALVTTFTSGLVEANILATIETLSTQFNNRYHSHPSGAAAAQWIRDLWAGYAAGRSDVTVELVNHSATPQPSVVLTIQGTSLADEVVVLGGHLDSTSTGSSDPNFIAPGADDNASGIATISEVARVLLTGGFTPERTVKLMGYAAEEVGLRGSQEIAQAHRSAGADVVGVLQLDMTGFHGSTPDMALMDDFTNPSLITFIGILLDTYMTDVAWAHSACGYGCSDHAAWHNRSYPAAFVFEARFGQHNPEIHRTTDTTAVIGNSAAHAFKFARLANTFLVEAGIDGVEPPPDPDIFADDFETGDLSAWSAAAP